MTSCSLTLIAVFILQSPCSCCLLQDIPLLSSRAYFYLFLYTPSLLSAPNYPKVISPLFIFAPSFPLFLSSLRVPLVSHGVLAKLVTKLLDEKSQLPCGLGFLLQELITETGNILLDFLQLTFNTDTPRHSQGT